MFKPTPSDGAEGGIGVAAEVSAEGKQGGVLRVVEPGGEGAVRGAGGEGGERGEGFLTSVLGE